MSTPEEIDELEQLLITATIGELPEAQTERLNELLRNNLELRKHAVRLLRDDAALYETLSTEDAAQLFEACSLPVPPSPSTFLDTDSPPSRRSTSWAWPSLTGLAIVAGLVIAFKTGQAIAPSDLAETNPAPIAETQPEPNSATSGIARNRRELVGTLTMAENCEWLPAIKLGDHLKKDVYELTHGTARIHLRSGVELYLEGPAALEIKSALHVVFRKGNLVADVNESAMGFRVETPTTSVVDIGTTFAVSVDESGRSDIEVLSGAVSCLPLSGSNAPSEDNALPLLKPGSANRFLTPEDAIGSEIESAADQMQNLVALATSRRTASPQLLAYEGFEYPLGHINTSTDSSSWAGPWHRTNVLAIKPVSIAIRQGTNLVSPNWIGAPAENYAVLANGSTSFRTLTAPIDLSVDQNYFVSFLYRRKIVDLTTDAQTGSGISLRVGHDKTRGIFLGMNKQDNLVLRSGDQWLNGRKVSGERPLFIVLKIAARRAEPDQFHVRLFNQSSLPQPIEPREWFLDAIAADLDYSLDTLSLWSGAAAITMVDEIRIGTSWPSVVPLK